MKQFYILLLTFIATNLQAQNTINITDADINAGESKTWVSNNVYLLDGLVFVEEGATLTIEPGTVVKFTPRPDLGNPSALIISKGGKIFAEGTKENPIIFTAEADDVNNPTDLGPKDNALWGGIVILGNGVTTKNGNSSVNVEGIPTTEPRGLYGGNNNEDNSGILKFVSIRHGGRQIASGSELNGLTLGAVGSKTTLEYIEVYANSDDGIEFFGGAPNLKYAVVAFAEDDSYDWDETYTGKGQFWFSIQRDDIADAGGEFDGSTPDDVAPASNPVLYNWTHIGSGPGAAAANPIGWNLRAGTAGTIANSILLEQKGKLIEVQDKAVGINEAYSKLKSGDLKLLNNILFKDGATIDATSNGIIRVSSTAEETTAIALINHLNSNKNLNQSPKIVAINRNQENKLDPRACVNGAAYNTDFADIPNDAFFTDAAFKGAFSAEWDELWIKGWTTLSQNNHLALLPNESCTVAVKEDIADHDIYIYPNPTSDNLNLQWNTQKAITIKVFDLNGRQVLETFSTQINPVKNPCLLIYCPMAYIL
jgi:hypothetical protein